MPRKATAWVRPTVPRNVPSAFSIQIAICARSVGVKSKMMARSSAARDRVAVITIKPAINKPSTRDIRGRIIATKTPPLPW